ncbi:MAG: ABC transporter ATP-binding protein [Spirochaetaceae bacterium]|nr:MAG: ABC transporter ATP-binding protein [Spirochaetaceae bacterium]
MNSSSALSVSHLFKSYGSLRAVNDLSFSVAPSTCFGVLGPNGAGKTTMMKTLYGKAEPDAHPDTRMEVFGFDPRRDQLRIKTLCGIVPQEDNLDVELNVEQNLRIFADFYAMPRKAAGDRIGYLLDFMELGEKRTARVRELSGGMKRRLIIARALLNDPALLILDEPTTGLDPQVRQLIWDKLRSLKREGVTILLTTHYMEEAFQIADTILIMDKGNRIMEGNPQRLLEEHLERNVLELMNVSRAERLAQLLDGVHTEASAERVLYFSSDLAVLQEAAARLEPGDGVLRQTNLEDLFLRATGRRLNELQ